MIYRGIVRHCKRFVILPFCVRTGAPECLVPATDSAAASVDILSSFIYEFIKINARHTFDSGRRNSVATILI